MVIANPPLAEPVIDPGGVTIKPPFEMGVANFETVKTGFCEMAAGIGGERMEQSFLEQP